MNFINNILTNYNVPVEIIDYIYQFDDSCKNNYNNCINELSLKLVDYNKSYHFCKRVIENSFYGDEATYSFSNDCFEWAKIYGLNYNPAFYLLNQKVLVNNNIQFNIKL